MDYLALDYGRKRIGIAGSDSGLIVQPLAIINGEDSQDLLRKTLEKISQYQPKEIIIGLPVDAQGNLTVMAQEVKKFSKAIKKSFINIPIYFTNEILSSFAAEQRSGKTKREHIDDHAAAVILEQYLTQKKGN